MIVKRVSGKASAPALGRRAWAVLLLAWLPLAIGYPIAIGLMAESWTEGITYGLQTAAIGGLLIAGVWWFSGRLRWPDHPSARFYLAHLAAALVYAGIWWLTNAFLAGLRSEEPVLVFVAAAATGPYLGWNLMFGIVAYGLVAGVSYALRAAERARSEQIRAAEADALATRAQLTALQAQLNPHFLFNTLHSLSVLIRRDPAQAEDALDRLGELLRYALDHGARDQVLLREEWAFVENYLTIEQLRLGERLNVVRDVDPEALRRRVPPFCLQPLVENAIRHGLDPRPRGGTLEIRLAIECGRLALEVRDDGVGTRLSPESLSNGEGSAGLGLRALDRRLAAWDDEMPGRLHIESTPGAGFVATVVFGRPDGRPHGDNTTPASDVETHTPGKQEPIA